MLKLHLLKNTCFKLVFLITASIMLIQHDSFSQNIEHLFRLEQGLMSPVRIAVDNSDNIYVTDAFQRSIIKYDASGYFLEAFSPGGLPVSIAINKDNLVFAGDSDNGKIIRLETDGTKTEIYSGSIYPSSMVISNDNFLYVVDNIQKVVIVMDLNGNVVRTIGQGILIFPTGIAFDNKNKRILVAEHGGTGTGSDAKIWLFDLQGNLTDTIGSYGNEDGQFYRIQGMTIGKCGNIYVIDPFQANVSIFDESGNFISKFGRYGIGPDRLNIPMDIVFDSQERILITSMNNGSLEVYGITDSLPCSNITSENASICDGDTTDILVGFTGTAPWTFTYTIDSANPVTINNTFDNPYVLTVFEPGVYEIVSLSDANYTGSCFTGIVEISVSPFPTSNISNEGVTVCVGDTAHIAIDFTGASPWAFTYTIDGANPKAIDYIYNNPYNLKATGAGVYEIIALSGANCDGTVFTGSASINLYTLPTSVFVPGNDSITICADETVDLTLEFTGEAPWAFTYTINDTNPVTVSNIYDNPYYLSASVAGIYTVTSISDVNCTNTSPDAYYKIMINMPKLDKGVIICEGDTYTLNAGPGFLSYLWMDESVNQTLSVSSSGNYSVTVTDENGCQNSDSVFVTMNPLPSSNITGGTSIICSGDTTGISIDFTGDPPWSFTYIINGLNPSMVSNITDNPYLLTASETGVYEITELFDANCKGAINTGSAEIVIIPLIVINLGEDIDMCEGETYTINAGADYVYYSWNDESTNQTLNVSTSGYYSVTVTDENGCENSDTVLVNVNLKPIADFSYNNDTYTVRFLNNSQNAGFYIWAFGDNETSDETNPVHVYQTSGEYAVTLIASTEYCGYSIFSESINVTGVQVENIEFDNIVIIYPNPSSGLVTMKINNHFQSDLIVEISAIAGQKIYSKTFENQNAIEYIDLSRFSKGVYIVKMVMKDQVKTARLILIE